MLLAWAAEAAAEAAEEEAEAVEAVVVEAEVVVKEGAKIPAARDSHHEHSQ
jgi:hypothetical protein